MGSWLGHYGHSRNLRGIAYKSVAELAQEKPAGPPPSVGFPHTCLAPQAQDQKAHQNREEKPIFPPKSHQCPLLGKLNTVAGEQGKMLNFSEAEKWRGDGGLEGNKFLNATAGNCGIWGEKLVDEAVMWERNSLFTVNLCIAWFGGGTWEISLMYYPEFHTIKY